VSPYAVAIARARTSARRARQSAARLLEERSQDQETLQALLEAATGIETVLSILASQDAAVLARELYSGEG
jgi:hypothetical protein